MTHGDRNGDRGMAKHGCRSMAMAMAAAAWRSRRGRSQHDTWRSQWRPRHGDARLSQHGDGNGNRSMACGDRDEAIAAWRRDTRVAIAAIA
jgi:hypothetical protein